MVETRQRLFRHRIPLQSNERHLSEGSLKYQEAVFMSACPLCALRSVVDLRLSVCE
jgi:hypothetical protein